MLFFARVVGYDQSHLAIRTPPATDSSMKTQTLAGLVAVAAFLFAAVSGADTPFDGKSLAGWKAKHPGKGKWTVGSATVDAKNPRKLVVESTGTELINEQPASDLLTEAKYGDCTVEVE